MSPISIGILAVSMSVDAFIASLGRGAQAQRPDWGQALRTGAVFGAVEAITPLLGWAMGVATSRYVQKVDHWIAFALLGAVGIHMVLQALRPHHGDAARAANMSIWALVGTAIGTSVDAMAIGVSLAFLDVNIVVIALTIGFATMVMSSTGILAGRYLGSRFGRVIETLGGVALVCLGAGILYEHLSAA